MPQPRFEVPTGVIDDVNTVFYVSVPYKPGTTAVFLNGLLMEPSLLDGWTESDPATGEVTLNDPPRSGRGDPDVVQIFFIDLSPALPETVVERLTGRLTAVSDELTGRLVTETFHAALDPSEGLEGRITTETLNGTVEEPGQLHGRLEAVC
jgi:hypothetical protein